MKYHHLIVALLLSLMTGIANADFSGEWEGTGKAWDSTGWEADCEIIQVELRQTSTKLQRLSGGSKCGTMTTTNDPIELEIRGTELWFSGTKVGDITNETISIAASSGPFTVTYRARLIDSKTLSYEEKLSGENGFLITQGTLSR